MNANIGALQARTIGGGEARGEDVGRVPGEAAEAGEAPIAPRAASVRELHGERVADDYAWMAGREDPALHAYLVAERAYYDAQAGRLQPLAARLADEGAARVPGGDEYSVSWEENGFTYRTRLPADADEPQLLRRGSGESEERVLLDVNLLAAKTGFAELGAKEASPNGKLLAWSVDRSGAEIYELRIRDLATGEDLPDLIPRSSGVDYTIFGAFRNVVWSSDSQYLFYLVTDRLMRPSQLWRHRVGTVAGEDVLVLEETDQRFDLALESSQSGELAVVLAKSRDTTEVHVIPLASPLAEPILIEGRRQRREYQIDHARGDLDGGSIYVVTDDGEPEYTLMRAPLARPGRENWSPVTCAAVAPSRQDTRLLRCDVLADHLLLTVRRGGAQLLIIADHDGGSVREVDSTFPAGWITLAHVEGYESASAIVLDESLIEPPAWYRLDLSTGSRELIQRTEVESHQPDAYLIERRSAPAPDGTAIPVTLAYRADIPLDGTAPCLLYGYGAYETCLDPDFLTGCDPEFHRVLPSLLDRGVVFAVAHVRGGGENGRHWWQQGRLRHKRNTFTDYIAVADWLAGSLIDGSRIVSRGLSAGGLVQGAIYSMRPDRWRAVVAEVPFVDCVNSMLNAEIPLTITEWDEWGDPHDPEDYAYMKSYTPYENPPAGPRPPLLVTGALHDPRVGITEPAKWVAKLRATDTAASSILFRAELGAGAHTGPTGRAARFAYEAEVHAFILDAMGIAG